MQRRFVGVRENPFNVNPNPCDLSLRPGTREVVAGLTYGVRSRQWFISPTREVEIWQTTLLNKLLDRLHQHQVAAAFLIRRVDPACSKPGPIKP